MLKIFSDVRKNPSYRLPGCGNFPNYKLDNVSLNSKRVIYLISVGKEKFEAKWIERFINFINEIQPVETLILVADSLQRFNIEVDENLSENEAYRKAITRGNKWEKKYESYFSRLTVPYQIIRWDRLKEDKDYNDYFRSVVKLSESDELFTQKLLTSSKEYIQRPTRLQQDNQVLALEKSNAFLLEECAGLKILAKNQDNKLILYPGKATAVLEYFIKHINIAQRNSKNNFHWIELRPTKEHRKNEANDKLQYMQLLPFFKLERLSLTETETETETETKNTVFNLVL